MDFKQYLLNRNLFVKNARKIEDTSADQYNNRLVNLKKNDIYNEEMTIGQNMIQKINQRYANKANEYERTIKYYLEYKKICEKENFIK
ncbi:hypothetical protein ACIQ4I_00070 [Rummeliibacillus sp. NPDC094406]|uniref:hypothetical protein n=1 Tax=Rummeliibacillus sp. NPDC094406 TaxID=3364511 RepID=UPI00380C13B7